MKSLTFTIHYTGDKEKPENFKCLFPYQLADKLWHQSIHNKRYAKNVMVNCNYKVANKEHLSELNCIIRSRNYKKTCSYISNLEFEKIQW